jgi:hypothetical protein
MLKDKPESLFDHMDRSTKLSTTPGRSPYKRDEDVYFAALALERADAVSRSSRNIPMESNDLSDIGQDEVKPHPQSTHALFLSQLHGFDDAIMRSGTADRLQSSLFDEFQTNDGGFQPIPTEELPHGFGRILHLGDR